MLGAITGDIVGSIYEWSPIKTKEFPLFNKRKSYTDDTVMTCAVANALLSISEYTESVVKQSVIENMVRFGCKYRDAGYGGNFLNWLFSRDHKPYGSYGNGSAMRVSSAGWLFDSLEETRKIARWTAEVTHNHPEGVKGAEAVASVIYLARTGMDKKKIRKYIKQNFYPLNKTCDEIRPGYLFDVSCQGTVPQAIQAFLEGNTFEDVIRTAVSLGGDSDTLTCIAGSMAEAYYGIPNRIKKEAMAFLPDDLEDVVNKFYGSPERKEKIKNELLHERLAWCLKRIFRNEK